MKHVHVESSGRDCDGRMDHSHIAHCYNVYGQPESGRRLATFSEELAWMTPSIDETEITVSVRWTGGEFGEGDPLLTAYRYRETEEGYSSVQISECISSCVLDAVSQRDYRAEAAGY